MSGPRVGIDATGIAVGGGLTWLQNLVPALARVWPEANVSVVARRGVASPRTVPANVSFRRVPVPGGAARMGHAWLGVPAWATAARLSALLVGSDAGPFTSPCRMVQVVQNANVYAPKTRRHRWLQRAAKATARAADTTVFVSEAVRALAEPILAPRRSIVIRHGIVPAPNGPVPRSPLSSPYVLCVATPYEHKDLATALEAVLALRRKGRPERFVLVGAGGDEGVVEDLERRAALDPEALVLVGTVVSAAELDAWYAHAAAFVLPSREESYGLPLAEALARGVPSVSSDIPALVETAAGKAIHHPAGDANACAAALERALAVLEAPETRRVRGLRYAASWTWEDAARRYQQVLTG